MTNESLNYTTIVLVILSVILVVMSKWCYLDMDLGSTVQHKIPWFLKHMYNKLKYLLLDHKIF